MRTLIADTREQHPYDSMSFTVVRQKLDEGDYTLKELLEYEKQTGKKTIRIERKATTLELAGNLGKLFVPFEKEIQRLQQYEEKYLICEFTREQLASYPHKNGISKYIKKNIRMTGKFMLMRLAKLEELYDISIIFAGSRNDAIIITTDLLNGYADKVL